MANHHYYVPAGLPPGEGPQLGGSEGPPEGVYYYRIFAGLMSAVCMGIIIAGLSTFMSPALAAGSSSPAASKTLVEGFFLTLGGVVPLVPFVVSLVGGRRPWVHTLGMVMIILTLITICCFPLSVPMLVYWQKPETKRWYGAT